MENKEIKQHFQKLLEENDAKKKAKIDKELQFQNDCKEWAKDMLDKFGFLEKYDIEILNKGGLLQYYSIDKPLIIKKGFGGIKFQRAKSLSCPICLRYCLNDPLNTKGVWKNNVVMAYSEYLDDNDMEHNKIMSIDEFLKAVIKQFNITL